MSTSARPHGNAAAAFVLMLYFTLLPFTAPASAAARGTSSNASQQLAALLAAADEAELDLTPMIGLARGDLRRAAQFGDLISDAHHAKVEANARSQLRQLRGIHRAALSPKEQIAYDAFRYQTGTTLRAYQLGIAPIQQKLAIDPVFGMHVTFAQTASGEGVAPYKTAADYDNGLKRIDGFVLYLDRAIEKMRLGIQSGHVHPRVVTEKLIKQLDAELQGGIDASPYLRPTHSFPDSFTPEQRAHLKAAYRAAVAQQILPALGRLASFLKTRYLSASRTGAPGLAALPGGATLYGYTLEQHTTVRLSAREIHRLGRAEVARIRAEMERIRVEVGFQGTLADFFKHLQTETRFKFDTREELLARYEDIRRQIDAVVPQYFSPLPKGKFELRPYPKEQEGSGGGAYYVIGTPDGQRPGVFYINTSDLPTRTSPRMTALLLHEAVPGHHLQGSLAQEDPALPALLRFAWNPGYGEGWALYSEWLGTEMGLYADPYQRFGRLEMEMFRAARLVVDTGLHAQGWSRERAIRFMAENSSLDAGAAEQEIDRYIVWPGQAVSYKVGELFIRKLRSKAQARLGAAFDIREFHRQVLDTGALPLAVLGKKIDDWIEASAPRASGAGRGVTLQGTRP